MILRLILLFTSIILISISCTKDCTQGDGKLSAEVRELEEYDKLVNPSTYDVFITNAMTHAASLQGDSNIVSETQLNVSGGELEINPGNFCSSTLNLRVDLVVPTLTKITNEGTGNIRGTTNFSDLEIINDGTGDIDLTGQSQQLLDITNEGTGSVLLYDLGSEDVIVRNTGTGDVFVFVSGTLDVTLEGTGNVYYKGRPEIISNITGIGQLIDDN